MKFKLFILAATLFRFIHGISQTPDYLTVQASHDDSGNVRITNFDFLNSALKNADIVLLGEPTHHPQYYDLKVQIVKYLCKQMGYDVLAFESGFYQMETANTIIKNGGDIPMAFENSLFPIWTQEIEFEKMYAFIDTIRHKGKKLDITGFDNQVSAYYASKRFVSDFTDALGAYNLRCDTGALQFLQKQFESLETGRSGLTSDFNEASLKSFKALLAVADSRPELSLYQQSLRTWIGHFEDLYYNKILEKLEKGRFSGADTMS